MIKHDSVLCTGQVRIQADFCSQNVSNATNEQENDLILLLNHKESPNIQGLIFR